jgi:hypothetical protein
MDCHQSNRLTCESALFRADSCKKLIASPQWQAGLNGERLIDLISSSQAGRGRLHRIVSGAEGRRSGSLACGADELGTGGISPGE